MEYKSSVIDWVVSKIKFLDETGSQLNMTRKYGRGNRSERVIEAVPTNHHTNYTLIGVIGLNGFQAPWVLEGPLNGEQFRIYLEQVLLPNLQQGDILVMDNLRTHKVEGVTDIISSAGARLEFLPPHSPDFNPIEQCWSKIKTYLRKAKARTYDELVIAIKEALMTIKASDIRAWFTFCGYTVH